jgi:transcriptional regulator with XRE-family HTH domain
MQSQRKTTVAVLRGKLGLTVEEFAKLIDKSPTTINSLESGRLKLSEETAHTISQETGVDMYWLLKSKPKEKPYYCDASDPERLYTKEVFEQTQARKLAETAPKPDPDSLLINALQSVTDWIGIYAAARRDGKGYLAHYLMSEFLTNLEQRLGKDTEAALQANKKARIIDPAGFEWGFTAYGDHLVLFSP